jgi:hypothetical protein
MLRPLLGAVFGFVICAGGLQANEVKKAPDPTKGHAATVKSVAPVKKTLTVVIKGQTRVVNITADTKIIGPRGGVSEDGLKDDRLRPGAKIKIVFNPGGKSAKEIHLGARKKSGKDKKK